ncbi:response regulator transcription factor [Dyella sp. SG609]|uniref:response regulator transcription factor n=1 Tax=Dyella sp. SG609 TaxID=2587018 RepID=UPI001447505A|nr:response regulator transcription factor [Dyella sp. SG609]NKJ20150.1 DNA-binding response OmpR family regulator [Dyella sp. SG609]
MQATSSSSGGQGAWRVAVLEDDCRLREDVLVPGLLSFGFEAVGIGRAAELYRRMLAERFDLAVLDLGLPDEDGLSVARHLRRCSQIGIVVLTGRTAEHDEIRALTAGADIYLRKPAGMALLAASLHSVGRRLPGAPRLASPAPAIQAAAHAAPAGWRLSTDDWNLVAPTGESIPLSASERCVLRPLFAAGGGAVAREVLIGAWHGEDAEFDPHRLEMLIYRLRRKARALGMPVLPLITVRGGGYAFVGRGGSA